MSRVWVVPCGLGLGLGLNSRCNRCPRLWDLDCNKLCRIWKPARSERTFPSGRSALEKTLREKKWTSEAMKRRDVFVFGASEPSPGGFSTFDVFGHGLRRVPVGVDGDQDGSQVWKRLDSIFGKHKQASEVAAAVSTLTAAFLPISSTTSIIFSSSSGQMSGQWVKPK